MRHDISPINTAREIASELPGFRNMRDMWRVVRAVIINSAHTFFDKDGFSHENTERVAISILSGGAPYTASSAEEKEMEMQKKLIKETYGRGYLFNAIEISACAGDPVFKYNDVSGRFLFIGTKDNIMDKDAFDDLLIGNSTYLRDVIKRRGADRKYSTSTVYITGTTDQEKCRTFTRMYFIDAACAAAQGNMSIAHPFSKVPVMKLQDRELKQIGTLSDLQDSAKRNISLRKFHIYTNPSSSSDQTQPFIVVVSEEKGMHSKL